MSVLTDLLSVTKRVLLADDDVELLAEMRQQLGPLCPHWDLVFTHSGAKALELLQESRFDALICDLDMPQMGGLEVLRRAKAAAPGAVRIVLSNVTEWNTSLQLIGIAHQYLPKPCPAGEIVEALARAFSLRDQLLEERLRRLIAQIPSLPSLPSLYMDLLSELRSEKSSTGRVAEIISRDLGMSTKLLQLANSAFFGLAQRVGNPTEAVLFLGVATVQSLVLSMQIFSLFEKVKIAAFSFPDLWMHSWVTGLLARKIAESQHLTSVEAQECFTAGLLHDVGKLVLATSLPWRYEQAMLAVKQRQLPVWQAEREVFGSSHGEVGAYLLGLWGLPDSLVEAVAFHHDPRRAVPHGFNALASVHLANALIPQKSPGHLETDAPVDPAYLGELGLAGELPGWQKLADDLRV